MKMTIQKTVENSDIHGILVSWEHEGVFYELWEDDARDSMDAVIEMASAMLFAAQRSKAIRPGANHLQNRVRRKESMCPF